VKRGAPVIAWVAFSAIMLQAQPGPAAPQSSSPQSTSSGDALGPASVDAGDYVYVSGQGPRRADGSIATNFPDQVRQTLDNVKRVVGAAGLSMDHVVYVQVYLEDTNRYRELNEVFAEYFPNEPPARAVLGVARLPEAGVQINAVAVRDLKGKHSVAAPGTPPNKAYSAGMLTYDRLFVSTMPGSEPSNGNVPQDPAAQVNLALDRMKSVLEAAGLTMGHMVFVNPYLTSELPMRTMNQLYAKRFEFGNTPGRATIEVSSLPEGAHIAYTGVAVRDLSQRKAIRPKNMPPSPTASPCVFAGETLYCSAKSGFIPGQNGGVYAASTADQTRQTMRNLLDNLEEANMNYDQVVSTTIYLDDLSETPIFGKVYKKYFSAGLPAQTTLQQLKSGERKANDEGQYPDLEQMSLIAVKGRKTTSVTPKP
jgi:reactive intermediate/imine deaminase